MIKAEIRNNIKFPEITLQSTLEEIAERVIIQDIINGISSRKAIDGGNLPKNELKTIKRKGRDNPLDDTGTLKNSFIYHPSGKNKVIISILGDRKDIAGYLQNDGVQTIKGTKYYRFFGISKDAYRRSMAYARNKIKDLTSGGK